MLTRRAINGHVLPPPRPTKWAVWYALLYLGVPFLLFLALADFVLWLLFTKLLGRCYGIFCFFE